MVDRLQLGISPEVSDALFELPEPAESPVVTLKQMPSVNQEEF
jgi:hypothetical protein